MAPEPRADLRKVQMPKPPPIVWGPTESFEWAKTAYGTGKGRKSESPRIRKAKISIVLDFGKAILRVERKRIPSLIASECLRELRKQRFTSVTRFSARARILSSVVDVPKDIDKCISFIMRTMPVNAAERGIALTVERRKDKTAEARILVTKLNENEYRLSLIFKGVFADNECMRLMRGLEKRLDRRYRAKISH